MIYKWCLDNFNWSSLLWFHCLSFKNVFTITNCKWFKAWNKKLTKFSAELKDMIIIIDLPNTNFYKLISLTLKYLLKQKTCLIRLFDQQCRCDKTAQRYSWNQLLLSSVLNLLIYNISFKYFNNQALLLRKKYLNNISQQKKPRNSIPKWIRKQYTFLTYQSYHNKKTSDIKIYLFSDETEFRFNFQPFLCHNI